jgi:hypothetical protein
MDKVTKVQCDNLIEIGRKLDERPSRQIDESVSVTVLIFPDGMTHWFENKPVFKDKPNENLEYMKKCIRIWNERNRIKYGGSYDNFDLMGAVANIRMLREDFNKIPATCDFL